MNCYFKFEVILIFITTINHSVNYCSLIVITEEELSATCLNNASAFAMAKKEKT